MKGSSDFCLLSSSTSIPFTSNVVMSLSLDPSIGTWSEIPKNFFASLLANSEIFALGCFAVILSESLLCCQLIVIVQELPLRRFVFFRGGCCASCCWLFCFFLFRNALFANSFHNSSSWPVVSTLRAIRTALFANSVWNCISESPAPALSGYVIYRHLC